MYQIYAKLGIPKGAVQKILLIMRLIAVFMFAAIMQVSASTYAQRITMREKTAPLEKIFKEIRRQSGYDFVFDQRLLEKAVPVSINLNNATLEQALLICFSDQPFDYTINEKTIIVKEKKLSLINNVLNYLASINARGIVKDESGSPLAGATVKIKGKNISVTTNKDGEFLIRNIEEGAVVVISYIGYESKEVKATEDIGVIKLLMSYSKLDDVQVIAYGSTTKRLNTGAVSSIKAATIEKQPVGNLLSALSGQVPGLQITQSSGVPGAAFTVRVRGDNSLNPDARSPLFIVDGVPVTSNNIRLGFNSTTLNMNGGTNPLSAINPNDIESVEVLKDADATAIYGSRGANGVILITLKKGKAGRTTVDVNVYQGIGEVSRMMKLLNTRQYLDSRYEAYKNDGIDWKSSAVTANDLKVWDTTRYTNWQKELIGGKARYTNAQATITGGNANTNFSLGGTFWRETTVFKTDGANVKGSGKMAINHHSDNNRFTAQVSATIMNNDNSLPSASPVYNAISMAPNSPELYKPDGTLNWENGTFSNPLADLKKRLDVKELNLTVNGLLGYKILENLEFKTNLGYSNLRLNSLTKQVRAAVNPSTVSFVADILTSTETVTNYTESWNIEPQLEYRKQLGPGNLTALVGGTFQQTLNSQSTILANGYLDDELMNNLINAGTITYDSRGTSQSKYLYNAIFGRLNYNIQNKYLLNFTGRRDGSSRFGPGKQFGNFGAVGGAWVFGAESFVQKSMPFLSFGKLRASYGITGSDAIGDYAYLATYNSPNTLQYGGISTLNPSRLSNPDFQWEVNKKMDLALDLGFLKDRILFNVNYYRNRSSSQLVGYPLPRITGFASVQANLPATVQNTGFEFELNTANIKGKSFSWTSSFNLTLPKNKLVSYPGIESSTYANVYQVGYPLDLAKVYTYAGVDPKTGINQYADRFGVQGPFNTSNPFTTAENVILINTASKYYGGLGNSFQYKNFNFDFFFQFGKRTRYNDLANFNGRNIGEPYNQPLYVFENSWRKEGDPVEFQKFTQSFSNSTYYSRIQNLSNANYKDATFLRLNNLTFSYRFPEALQKQLKMSNFRVYTLAQNLFTITNWKGLDPEGANSSLPRLRVVTVGLQATF